MVTTTRKAVVIVLVVVSLIIALALIYPVIQQRIIISSMLKTERKYFEDCIIGKIDLICDSEDFNFYDWYVSRYSRVEVQLINKKTSRLGVSYFMNAVIDINENRKFHIAGDATSTADIIRRFESDSTTVELIRLSGQRKCEITAYYSIVFHERNTMLAFDLSGKPIKIIQTNPRFEYRIFIPFTDMQKCLVTYDIPFDEVMKLEYSIYYNLWSATAYLKENGDMAIVNDKKDSQFVSGTTLIKNFIGDTLMCKIAWEKDLANELFMEPIIFDSLIICLHAENGKYALAAF